MNLVLNLVMQQVPIHINFIGAIIFIGIFFGFFVSYFLIKKSLQNKSPNLFMGFLLLVLSLIMLEGWFNYTGYIFQVLWLTNFSEPLNFVIAPLIYLFMTSQLGDERGRKDGLHFIPFLLWLGYCMFFFTQLEVFKYNDNIRVMQLGIAEISTSEAYAGDPLSIRNYVNIGTIIHIFVYNIILTRRLLIETKKEGVSFFKTTNKALKYLRNSFYHFLIVMVILILVKSNFESDVGDYLIFLYLSFMIFMTAYQIMNDSNYFNQVSNFLEGPVLKYKKSSLEEDNKKIILEAIKDQMQNKKYFTSGTASLSGLAKSINQSSHHVSQVINEKLEMTFFELLASYRVEEAKIILKTDLGKKLTIEEVAERVGYNSKSAFNTAFKKFNSQTPSAFRDL
ncbi:AraC family transcriptional regulator [Aquimarina sp. Aq78]|uniref:helix-turn-helix domain-containing protein n=1 Tax=Aquimarina sp. Aq78 TaxID=1191889 RepID=UPI000D0E4A1A|nr:helix-turn-helix domain-containing protein [Aquimarina sp. Aq78]